MKKISTLVLFVLVACIGVYAHWVENKTTANGPKNEPPRIAGTAKKNAIRRPAKTRSLTDQGPMLFLENNGQITDQNRKARNDIQFALRATGGLNIFIGNGAIHYQYSRPNKTEGSSKPMQQEHPQYEIAETPTTYDMYRMDVELVGADKNARLIKSELNDYVEYDYRNTNTSNVPAVHAYGKITYLNVYPKIDWVLYTKAGKLKHEFVVHEGGDPEAIKLKYSGATALTVNKNGDLVTTTPQGIVTEQAPYTYQKDGKKIESAFRLSDNVVSYATGDYSGELIIDPTLGWATYFGSAGNDRANAIKTDAAGNIYMAGRTTITSDLATSGAHQVSFGGTEDIIVVKFNSAGVRQWSTYYGGTDGDVANGIAVSSSGSIYVAGYATSSGLGTSGAFQEGMGGSGGAILVKFNSNGVRQWATYYGAESSTIAYAVAVTNDGKIWLAGSTTSATGIATAGAHDETFGGTTDAYLAKFDSSGTRLYGSYYGGSGDDKAFSIAVDGSGNAYIAGQTTISTEMGTSGAHQPALAGGADAFLAKFNSAGVRQWGTYFGGSTLDVGNGVAVDNDGNPYLTGMAASTTGIATSGAHQTVKSAGVQEAYLAKFNTSGTLLWGTYYGGSGLEQGNAVVTDGTGNVWMAGSTQSPGSIATTDGYQTVHGGGYDAFMVKFNSAGVRQWATYHGGATEDRGLAIAIDPTGNAWLAGYTNSSSGIASSGAHQTTIGGDFDAFISGSMADVTISPPTITSLSPSFANPGTLVTITGTNFNTTPANNIVYFGATKATVTAASATSLTATVPSGATYMPVSVNNTSSSLSGFSQYPFLPTYDNSLYVSGIVSFAARVDITSGSNPEGFASGDIDGDGKPDLVVANSSSNTISVYRNISTAGTITSGSFAAKVDFSTGSSPRRVAATDFDGDGKLDIVVSNISSNTISVFRNTATSGTISAASLTAKVDFATGGSPNGVATGDIDGDGKPDIIVANNTSHTITVFRNTSVFGSLTTGSFAPGVDFTAGTGAINLSVTDLDGDGKHDVVLANNGANTVGVFRNTATVGVINSSSLATMVTFATGSFPNDVVTGDFDGDGKNDIACANYNSNTVSVFRNTATSGSITAGSFASKVDFVTASLPLSISAADVDGNGKPEIIVVNNGSSSVSVLRNTATTGVINSATFAAKEDFTTGPNPRVANVCDYDGDGKPDIGVSNNGTALISILRDNPPLAPPTVTSVTPNMGNPGGSVIITGAYFNPLAPNNIVYFGATKATVTAATTTSLNVTVPIGATYMPVSVMNSASALIGFSQYPFLSTWNNSAYSAGINLNAAVDFTAGSQPYDVAIGDIDGDGKADMVGCNLSSNTISIYRNTSTTGSVTASSFAAPQNYTCGTQPRTVALADLDGDGKLDIIVGNSGSNTVAVFLNIATPGTIVSGSLATRQDFTAPGVYGVAITDIDGDGRPEIIAANAGDNAVAVYRNTSTSGSISLASRVNFSNGGEGRNIATGDIDGDGKQDIAVVSTSDSKVYVYRNTSSIGTISSGSLASAVGFTTMSGTNDVAIGDLDGDGKADLIASSISTNGISLFRNISVSGTINSSSFDTRADISLTNPYGVGLGDMNGDGKTDICYVDQSTGNVLVLRNVATSGSLTSSSFSSAASISTGGGGVAVAVGDLDGDHKADIAIASFSSGKVSVVRNNPIALAPVVSAVSPNPANPGTSVTITGNYFNTTPANNIVYFGATQATVTAATATSLNVTVPVGASYMPVSVVNTVTNLSGYSQYPFLPKYDNSGYQSGMVNFNAKADVSTSTNPFNGAIGDIDGDGHPEIVEVNIGPSTISVYRNLGAGGTLSSASFASPLSYNTGSSPYTVALADLDNDGKLDVLVGNNGSGTASVFRNTSTPGSISFATRVDFSTGGSPVVTAADIDKDGKPEIITANYSANSISILRNTSVTGSITSGSFAPRVDFAAGSNPYNITTADFDGDGKIDIAVVNVSSNDVSVFRNTSTPGNIAMATKTDFSAGSSPQSIGSGDIDGDGKPEIVVANYSSATLSVFANTAMSGTISAGSFATKVDFATGSLPYNLGMGDFNGDGKTDIAVSNFSSNSVSIFRNTASSGVINSSSLAARVDLVTANGPQGVIVGDLNGDHKADIAVAAYSANAISIFQNTPLNAPPIITAVSPNPASPGMSVTITGTNFNTTPASNIVYFGATKATVTAATTTSLNVTVPIGATYMPVSVNNAATALASWSQYSFLPKWDNSGYFTNILSFADKVDFISGSGPLRPILGDVDGDGKPDIIVANSGSNTISVFRNTSTSGIVSAASFTTKVDFSTGTSPRALAFGDVDGDGKQDVLVANGGSNNISILRNTSTPGSISASSFAAKVDFNTSGSPENVCLDDLDGDGRPEMVTVSLTTGHMSVFKNTAVGGTVNSSSFAAGVNFTAGTNSRSVVIADFDGDGKKDIAVVTPASNIVSVFRNTVTAGTISTGSFAAKVDFSTGTNPLSVLAGDIDGDGKPDLVVANEASNSISVLRNTATPGAISSGSFATKVDFATVAGPYDMGAADFNGDGKLDIAVACETGADRIAVFRNTATTGAITSGSFSSENDLFQGIGADPSICAGDVDGDGKPEIVSAKNSSNEIGVYRNNPIIIPPTISAVSPNAANPGTSVTITGTNFNTTPANNIVYFGATKAIVTAATATSLNVTVPVGATHVPVSATNTALNLSAYSKNPFLPTWDANACFQNVLRFDGKIDFSSGTSPRRIALADLDGDGKSDIVAANYASNTISVYRNESTSGVINSGSFGAKVDFATGGAPRNIAVADIDADGKPEILVVNETSATVSVFRNTTTTGIINTSSFAAKVDFATGTNPENVAVGDIDGDGKPDMAVPNHTAATVSIYRNTSVVGAISTSSFASKVDFATGNGPRGAVIRDMDGDGKVDVILVNENSNTVGIFRNTATVGIISSATFASRVDFATGTGPSYVIASDIDGDGKQDMVATNYVPNTMSVLRNVSTSGVINSSSFSAKVDFATGTGPYDLASGDFNGDGKPDIAIANETAGTVSVLRNTSVSGEITTASFANKFDLVTGSGPNVTIGDADGDTRPDIVVANYGSNSVSILRNNPIAIPPSISSVSPNPASPGTSVTITGTNFNTTPASNIVYFGATKATVTAATTTSLNVTVPIGATYMPVSVNNTVTALSGYSQYPFLPVYDNSNYINHAPNFDAKVDFTSGATPFGVAIADLDGDGKSDIVTANYNSNTVSVYRNTSTTGAMTASSFATRVDFATSSAPYAVAVADVNGDGKLDIIASNASAGSVSVLQNTASAGAINTSSFAAKVDFSTGASPYSIAMADLDGDGKPEIVTANYTANSVSVLRNTCGSTVSSTSFAAKVDFVAGVLPISIAAADFDGDNKPDLAVANYNSNSVSIFRNTAVVGMINSSSLATKVDFTTGTNPFALAVGDLDGDGKQDIAVTNYGLYTLSLIRNTATSGTITSGSFAAKVDFTTSAGPDGLAIADMNGDGKADIVVSNLSAGSVSIFRNTTALGAFTSGSLAPRSDFATATTPEYVALGDLDGDSKPDIVVTNNASNSVSVIRNNPLVLPPTVTSVSPNPANPGTSVTMTGTNFNTTPANNIVYFGAAKATVTAATGTSLTATVPIGSTFAPISVLNTGLSLSGYSQNPFLPTWDNTGYVTNASRYETKVDFTAGGETGAIAFCDFDGDGKIDIAATNNISNTLSIYRNTTSSGIFTASSLAAKVDFVTGTAPQNIAVGDLDGDGKPDIVVANYNGTGSISVFRNTSVSGSIGGSSFAAKVDFSCGAYPASVAIADIDLDGRAEIIVTNSESQKLAIFPNASTIGTINSSSFLSRVNYTTITGSGSASGLAIGDIDGDGKPEIVIGNNGNANSVSVFRNTSTPGNINSSTLSSGVHFSTGTSPFSVKLSDVDGDGKNDVLACNYGGVSFSVLRNIATAGSLTAGSLAAAVNFTTGAGPRNIEIADINGDGKRDVVICNGSDNSVSVYLNTATSGVLNSSSFATRQSFATANLPLASATGDLDGDGKPDIGLANANAAGSISLLRNSPFIAPPIVASVSPNPANPGTSVTITGTNFNTTPANNIVYFGATKATVTAAGTTSLTATVPVGSTYKPVAVTNTGISLTGYAPAAFLQSFDTTGYPTTTVGLLPKIDVGTGTNSPDVVLADIDGDGKADMVTANENTDNISIYRNISSTGSLSAGSFSSRVDFAAGNDPESIVVADFDGDGKPDIATANYLSNTISIFRNTSTSGVINTSSLAAKVDFNTLSSPIKLTAGDVDGDGRPEIAVVNAGNNRVSVFRNISTSGTITTGSFAPKVDFIAGTTPFGVALSDLDGDGKTDMVCANQGAATVSVYRNTSEYGVINSSTFAAPVAFTVGTSPKNVMVADIDGDGKPEILTPNSGANSISVLKNTATTGAITGSSFAAKVDFATGTNPHGIVAGDLNGDGRPDIAIANKNSNSTSVLRNTSTVGAITTGSFAGLVNFTTGNSPEGVAIGDIDGDHKPDLVVSNYGAASTSLAVFRNSQLSASTGTASVCAGANTTLSNATAGGTWTSSNSFVATVGSATGVVTGLSSGTTTISYTVAGASVTTVITVNPIPTPGIQTGSAQVNVGANVTLTDVHLSVTAPGTLAGDLAFAATNYNDGTSTAWGAIPAVFSNVPVKKAPSGDLVGCTTISPGYFSGKVAFINRGTCEFSYKALQAQNAGATACIIINNAPGLTDMGIGTYGAGITIPVYMITKADGEKLAARIDAGDTILMSMTFGGGSGIWNSLNTAVASVSSVGVVTGLDTGNATIHYSITNGCGTLSSATNMQVTSPAAITGASTVCSGNSILLTGTPAGGSWSSANSGTASVDGSGNVTGVLAGTTTITYTLSGSSAIQSVTVLALPPVSAGSNVAICTGSSTGLTASGANTYTWSPATGLSATVGASVTASPSNTTTYTVNGTNASGCSNTATVTVSVNSLPPVSAGSNVAICVGSSTGLTASGANTYTWSPATGLSATVGASVTATPTSTTTYTVNGTNASGCSNTATVTVSVNSLPPVSTGSDVAVCSGSSTGLTASGATSYTWSPATGLSTTAGASVTATPTSTTTYTVNGINGSGCSNTATVTVSVNSLPPVSAGSNVSICTGSSTGLTATDANTYTWSPATGLSATVGASVTASPTSTTIYTVNGTNASGCSNTATVTVSVNSLPPVSAGSNVAICVGSSTGLTASGANTYTWSPAAGLSATVGASVTATPTSTTTYTVNGTNGSGCSNTATVTVSVNSLPPVSAGSNVAICVGSSTGLTASGANTYLWSPAVGLSATVGASVTASPTSTTIYTVNGTNASGCSNIATVTVSVNSLPPVSAGSNAAICTGSSTGLTATGANTYTWSPTTGLSATVGASVTASPSTTTTYTVNGTNASGCSNTATVTVSVNSLPPVSAGSDVVICTGSSTGLTASGANTYMWSPATGLSATVGASVTASPTSTTIYTVSGTNASGCSNTATVTVSVNSLPPVSAGSNVSICTGSSTGLTATGANTYTWSPATGLSATVGASLTASPTSTTIYTVNGTNASGCSNIATVTVSVNSLPPVSAGSSVAICVGSSTGLTASGANTYTWSPATGLSATVGSGVTATPTSTTTYTVNGTNASGCSNTATVTVSVNSLPPVSAGSSVAICTGSSTGLTASGANTYTWSPATGLSATVGASVTATPTSTTTYTVSGTNASGCSNTATVTVSVNSLPPVSAGSNVAICVGASTGLTASGANTYTWSPATGLSATVGASVTATPTSTTTYTVNGTNASGCGNTATVTVSVNSLPPVSAGSNVAICVGSSTGLTASGANTYTWSPATGLSATVGASVTAIPTSTTTYTVNGTNASGCSNTATVTVSVTPLPDPGTIIGSSNLCPGTTMTLTSSGISGGSWSSTNLAVATVSAGGIVTALTNGITTISYTVSNGCGTFAATKSVSVNPTAVPGTITGTATICVGTTTSLAASGTGGGVWSSTNAAVATVSAAGVVTGIVPGTSVISYTVTNGCGAVAAAQTVTVNQLANPGMISGSTSVCQASSTQLATNGMNGGTWSSTNTAAATVSASGSVTGVSAGGTIVSYTVTNLCGSLAATTNVTVAPLPATPDPIMGTAQVCVGDNVLLSTISTGGVWSSSNTTKATVNASGSVTGISAAVVTISYTISNSCGNAYATRPLTVNPIPATISGNLNICPGALTTLTNSPGGGIWSSPSSAVSVNPTNGKVTGVSPGNALISYTLPAGCIATTTVVVSPPPSAIGGTASVCPGATTLLTNSEPGGSWSSSSPAKATIDAATGVVTGVSQGISNITYTLTAGCISTTQLTVNAAPAAITGGLTLCPGNATDLNSGTTGGVWTSSNTAIATVHPVSGIVSSVAGVGTSNITYTVPALCPRTVQVTVAVPSPNTGVASVCLGQPISVTVLSNATPGGTWISSNTDRVLISSSTGLLKGLTLGTVIITYQLDPGCFSTTELTVNPAVPSIAGNTSVCPGTTTILTNPQSGGIWSTANNDIATGGTGGVISGISEGTTTVSYIVSAGCYKTTSFQVYGSISPITGIDVVCQGSETQLTSGAAGGTWTSGNTTVSVGLTTGTVTGLSMGTARITYKLGSSGCFVTRDVTINPAVATITGTANICPGFTASLGNSDPGGTWSSSNTARATVDVNTGLVTGISSGTSLITYMITPACYRTTVQNVKVAPNPIIGSSTVCQAATTGLSTSPAGGTWSSSNSTAATVGATGTVSGVAPGSTTIQYLLSSGCLVTREVTVNAIPDVITGSLAVCAGSENSLSVSPSGGVWTSSNVSKASIDAGSGVLTGIAQGTANITYMLSTGCFRKVTAIVNPLPGAIAGAATVAQGAFVNFTSSPAGGSWSSLASTTASVNATTGRVTGVSTGLTTISYQLSTGCFRTRDITVIGARGTIENPESETGFSSFFQLSPNPTSGTLALSSSVSGVFSVHTIDGKLVVSQMIDQQATTILLPADLAPGTYMCRFLGSDGKSIAQRLVVEK